MNNENTSSETQFGLSCLRILATFSVVIIHVSGPLVVKFGKISFLDWNVANFFDSISRYSVPMFFMISGALLLNKDYSLKCFFGKRLGKVLPPFLIWSLIYSVFNRYIFKEEPFNVIKIIKDVFYGAEYHLWFVYTLLGVYLTVPILRKWIKDATVKEMKYVLIIWLVTLILTIPNLKVYFFKIDLSFFSGFIGYFILGYYLSLFKFRKIVSVFLIVLGNIITIIGTYYFTIKTFKFYYYFYEYLCINTFLVSSGMFMFFNKMITTNKKVDLIAQQVNQTCFGIYLIHPLMLKMFKLINFDLEITTPVISIPLVGLSCFILCFAFVFLFKKLKYSEIIIG